MADRARAFFDALAELYAEHRNAIGPLTFAYWQEAGGLQPPALEEPADDE